MKLPHLAISCLILAAFFMSVVANAQTLRATWNPCDDCDGYRVYEYKNGEKILLQESGETSFESEITHNMVVGVVAYNAHGESKVIPRLAAFEKSPPKEVKVKIEIIINGVPTVLHNDLAEVE